MTFRHADTWVKFMPNRRREAAKDITYASAAKGRSGRADPRHGQCHGSVTVVPVFFDGRNSRLFQFVSQFHSRLRMGMFIREFKINKPVRVVIGDPIPADQLAAFKKDPIGCMDFLRKATYELSPSPVDASRLGHEFEDKYKVRDGSRHIR